MVCVGAAAVLLVAGFNVRVAARRGGNASTALQSSTSASGTGEIVGKVYFRGKAPMLRPIRMDKDPVCASQQSGTVLPEDGRVNENGTLPNAFVHISKGTGNLSAPAPTKPATLTQKGCLYDPHVLGIVVGQRLQVISEDQTTHNIHIRPKENREWNVTQQPGQLLVTTKFSHPEIMIPVRCNLHPWMEAFIGVVSNPYFAVTGDDGSFVIRGVPLGDYTLAIWTATFGTQERQATVRSGESTTVDFTFASE